MMRSQKILSMSIHVHNQKHFFVRLQVLMTLNTKIPAGSDATLCSAGQRYQHDGENCIIHICSSPSEQYK